MIVGVVMVEVLNVAVAAAAFGTVAGVQFPAVFQLLLPGTAFHVWARLAAGIRTSPQSTAIDDASILAGRTAGGC